MKNLVFRLLAVIVAAVCTGSLAFAQTHITDRAGLEAIKNNLSGSYVLDNDIDLSGSNWTPLSNFTGTLDGAGHVISNLTINDLDAAALFGTISGNAVVKNLGFEKASVADASHSRTAVVAAFLEGNAVIENCYIANSYIKGRWCVGSFVGRAHNITDGGNAAIRNCYSSAHIFVPSHSDNAGMAGGIIGNIYDGNKIVVENCYFSGIIEKDPATVKTEGAIAGVTGWIGKDNDQTISGYSIQNNVNLSPYLLSDDGKNRISSVRGGGNGDNDPTPGPNYSISTTSLSNYNDWGNTSAVVSPESANYGENKKDGANIPNGDANAKARAFYETTLGWNFTDLWSISEGASYPYFVWAKDTTSFVVVPKALSLTSDAPIDLSKYIFSGRGLSLTFTTESNKISINGSVVSFAQAVSAVETVIVTVQEGNLTPAYSLSISLVPDYIAIAAPTDLEQIRTLPGGKYVLTADLDMSGIDFTPIADFSGTLDGDGHVISHLTINRPSDNEKTAFFAKISNGSRIKNLGFENAQIVGNAQTAVVTGYTSGNTTIENCYIANSSITGRWCVGSYVGRAEGTATVRNCYSSALILTPATTDNSGHTGGIIGDIRSSSATVEKCYFSGIIQRSPTTYSIGGGAAEGQVAGIVAWNENAANTISKNVNLAPYLLSNNGKYRISSVQSDGDGNEPTGPNYSLSTTVVSVYDGWENVSDIVATNDARYGQNKKHGENIPNGDANAKTAAFYSTLEWDFETLWTVDEGGSYPYFQWADQTRPHFVVVPKALSLTSDAPIDLSKYIFSGRGLNLTFSTESDKITLNNGIVNLAQAIAEGGTVIVSVREGALTSAYPLEITLIPSYDVTIGTFDGGEVTADHAFYEAGKTVTLTISPDTGYELESISAYKTGDPETSVALAGEGNVRTFVMPAYGVTVTAVFRIPTGISSARVLPASIIAGKGEIKAAFEGSASVKLYSVTGLLLDETTVNNVYTSPVRQGIYILSVNGKAYKVIVK